MPDPIPGIPDQHLCVWLGGVLVGRLWQDGERRHLAFAYDPAARALMPVPLVLQSLPLRDEPHRGPEVEAFFGNLLPEGDVRTAVARALQISERNDYALLDALGGDCAGALVLSRPGAALVEAVGAGNLLSREELSTLVETLPRRPLLAGENGLRLSLAGAQIKLALCKAGDGWVRPAPGAVSTHILKPPIRDLPGSVENEAFCMTLAKRCDLGVPECWIEQDPYLYVVDRYDRFRDPATGRVRRLHQEDFCQALGIPASRKYEAEGGPSLKDCFALVSRVCHDPVRDRLRLLDWVIFNFFIGNHDAHAKNLSLLHAKGQTRLAPFYDLLSTAAYPELSDKFAMRIGGAESLRYMAMRHWRQFAEDCVLAPTFVLSRIAGMLDKAGAGAKTMESDFASITNAIDPVIDVLATRVNRFLQMSEAEKPQGKRPLG